jgi:hypothetical protein
MKVARKPCQRAEIDGHLLSHLVVNWILILAYGPIYFKCGTNK